MSCLAGSCAEIEGSGNGFWCEEPVGVLRKTSNRGPAEG